MGTFLGVLVLAVIVGLALFRRYIGKQADRARTERRIRQADDRRLD